MPIPGRNKPSIAILGTGGVGGFLAAIFYKAGFPVSCVVKEDVCGLISEKGILLESASLGKFVAHPGVLARLDFSPEILFVSVKAYQLKEAVLRLNPELLKATLIVPLLNGFEHIAFLRGLYEGPVVAATIGNVEVKKVSPWHVIHSTLSARIELASDKGVGSDRLRDLASMIRQAGITAEVFNSEAEVIWRKLVRLNAIACATAASNRELGFVRSDPFWREKLQGCVNEAAMVSCAEGFDVRAQEVMSQIDELPGHLGTSLQRDVASGRPSELDAIAGAVIRAGERHGIRCPVIREVAGMIISKKAA